MKMPRCFKKNRAKILTANKKGKFVLKKGKHECQTPFCKICGKKRNYHHWLCDKCWNKKYIIDGKFRISGRGQ